MCLDILLERSISRCQRDKVYYNLGPKQVWLTRVQTFSLQKFMDFQMLTMTINNFTMSKFSA